MSDTSRRDIPPWEDDCMQDDEAAREVDPPNKGVVWQKSERSPPEPANIQASPPDTEANRDQPAASLTLFSDGQHTKDRFAICDKDGRPVCYGPFSGKDTCYDRTAWGGKLAGAQRAVRLAAMIRDKLGLPSIGLTLKVDQAGLAHANKVRLGEKGGKGARVLGETAVEKGVVLTVVHVPAAENPAGSYAKGEGSLDWRETDLTALLG